MIELGKKLLPTRKLRARYHIVDRTVDRWVDRGVLPRPIWINGRRYWDEEELEQRERELSRDTTRRVLTAQAQDMVLDTSPFLNHKTAPRRAPEHTSAKSSSTPQSSGHPAAKADRVGASKSRAESA
jgi:hypothetical protein